MSGELGTLLRTDALAPLLRQLAHEASPPREKDQDDAGDDDGSSCETTPGRDDCVARCEERRDPGNQQRHTKDET